MTDKCEKGLSHDPFDEHNKSIVEQRQLLHSKKEEVTKLSKDHFQKYAELIRGESNAVDVTEYIYALIFQEQVAKTANATSPITTKIIIMVAFYLHMVSVHYLSLM